VCSSKFSMNSGLNVTADRRTWNTAILTKMFLMFAGATKSRNIPTNPATDPSPPHKVSLSMTITTSTNKRKSWTDGFLEGGTCRHLDGRPPASLASPGVLHTISSLFSLGNSQQLIGAIVCVSGSWWRRGSSSSSPFWLSPRRGYSARDVHPPELESYRTKRSVGQ